MSLVPLRVPRTTYRHYEGINETLDPPRTCNVPYNVCLVITWGQEHHSKKELTAYASSLEATSHFPCNSSTSIVIRGASWRLGLPGLDRYGLNPRELSDRRPFSRRLRSLSLSLMHTKIHFLRITQDRKNVKIISGIQWTIGVDDLLKKSEKFSLINRRWRLNYQ